MKEIREEIGIAIGEASMCWETTPKGVFDSDKAVDIGDRLTAEIKKIVLGWVGEDRTTGEARDWSYNTAKDEIRKRIKNDTR